MLKMCKETKGIQIAGRVDSYALEKVVTHPKIVENVFITKSVSALT
jgi:hypothetical protein